MTSLAGTLLVLVATVVLSADTAPAPAAQVGVVGLPTPRLTGAVVARVGAAWKDVAFKSDDLPDARTKVLFTDTAQLAEMSPGVQIRMNPPTKLGQIIFPEHPWESFALGVRRGFHRRV